MSNAYRENLREVQYTSSFLPFFRGAAGYVYRATFRLWYTQSKLYPLCHNSQLPALSPSPRFHQLMSYSDNLHGMK
jgi:hypothetical protein